MFRSTLASLALALLWFAAPALAVTDPPPSGGGSCDTPAQHPTDGCITARNQCEPPYGPFLDRLVERATFRQWLPLCLGCPAGSEVVPDGNVGCYCYQTNLPQLKDAGVPLDVRYNLRFATLHSVPKENVQNLVVAFGGQNGFLGFGTGGMSNLTGQPMGWDGSCNDHDCGTQTFSGGGLAERLTNPSVLAWENTHDVVFLDHQYNWEFATDQNTEVELGLTAFVKSLIVPGLGKTIVLTGHSRGGCLALTVARRLQQDPAFRDVHLIVLPLDAVCNPDRYLDENFTNWSYLDNPDVSDSSWYAWQSGYSPFAALSESACVANVVGGAPWAWPVNVHGLSISPDVKPLHRYTNWWATYAHDVIGQIMDGEEGQQSVGSFYYFVKNNLAPPACNAASCPNGCCIHGVCVDGTATWGCGAGGNACNVCASGQLCTNHVCAAPPSCGPATCPNGCCTAAGVCVAGTATSACGTGGAACVACSAPTNGAATCNFHACGVSCNAPYHSCDGQSCTKLACP
jgi:hypothetical protein